MLLTSGREGILVEITPVGLKIFGQHQIFIHGKNSNLLKFLIFVNGHFPSILDIFISKVKHPENNINY